MLASTDTAFAIKAAQEGLGRVQLGKLAADKSSNPDVKAFGQQMVDEHTKVNDQLKAIAREQNMTLPTTPNSKDQAAYQKLSQLSGIAFDKAYVSNMVRDHAQDVKEFQKEATGGKDPNIKALAAETEPMLQAHLDKIKAIRSKLGASSAM